MIGVDVRSLDLDEALCVLRCGTKALAQKFGYAFNQLCMKMGESL